VLEGRESELLRLFEEGHSIVAIAEKMNVSHSTVSLELERLGIRERATNKKVRAHFESIMNCWICRRRHSKCKMTNNSGW
jgi:IS30 family transposase